MKTLKINLNLVCLLAILVLSITSCNKAALESDITEEPNVEIETFTFKAPRGMSEEKAAAWAENLSYEEMKNLSTVVNMEYRDLWCYPWPTYYQFTGKTVDCNSYICYGSKKHYHVYHYWKQRKCYYDGQLYFQNSWKQESYCRSYC